MLSLNNIQNAHPFLDHIGTRDPKALVARFIGHGIGFKPESKNVGGFHPPPLANRRTKSGTRIYMRAYREYKRHLEASEG